MNIVLNAGTDRVIDLVRPWLADLATTDLVTRTLLLPAFCNRVRSL